MVPANDEIERHYDELADIWSEIIDSPGRRRILWPTVRDLLPDVTDARVLDAGCGDGHYSAWLAEHGADVVGIDASHGMVETANERHGDHIDFRRADLADALPFDDESFDVVLCQHVFSHLETIETPIEEFARILRPGGSLVLSTHHPFRDYIVVRDREHPDTTDLDLDPIVRADAEVPDYWATERFEVHWSGGGNDDSGRDDSGDSGDGTDSGDGDENPGVYYRRPLSDIVQALLDAGFSLEALCEPGPDADFERDHPNVAAELARWPPGALVIRADR